MTRKTYENEALGVSFSLPETVTLRQQLMFRSRLLDVEDDSAHLRWWIAALPLIEDWQCEAIPDLSSIDLDEPGDWRTGDIIQYVANASAGHFMEMADVPKKT